MKAYAFKNHGGAENLELIDLETPIPEPGQVLIKIRARGINRAEIYMRQGLWGDGPGVTGIECVGEIVTDTTATFRAGQKVAAVMGGMGREFNGSYGEFVTVGASNVFAVSSTLDWGALAALPESYATAWSAVINTLKIKPKQIILIHGGTSALGQAAINIAKGEGLTVIATTRQQNRRHLLERLDVDHILIDDDNLSANIRKRYPEGIDHVLELVGTSSLLELMKTLKKGGHICMAGVLGGNSALENFNPLFDLPIGVHLSAFGSYVFGTVDFPSSDIPMQMIIDKAENGTYKAAPDHVFPFSEMLEAHRLMDSYQAEGKVVVTA